MLLHNVRGGVRMAHHKVGADLALQVLSPPPILTVPLLQHRGAPARALVKRGDNVLLGQRIGEPTGLGCPVHSPVSGKVTAVALRMHPSGVLSEAVVIENDGMDTPVELATGVADPSLLTPEEIRQRVQDAGIVGMGGAMFPTAIKLAPREPVDTLIVNGCECEPYLTCDHRVMLERSEDLAYGWQAIQRAVGAEQVIVAIEENKPDAIAKLREVAAGFINVTVVSVPAMFPQGAEGVLIRRVTGRRLRARGIPTEVGCLVQNVSTVVAVAEALRDGRPLISRALTVAGSGVEQPANLWVRIGTPISYILDYVGRNDDLRQLVAGGPMMGQCLPSDDIPIIKGTSGILAFTSAEVLEFTEGICLRCGACVEVCPEGLMPFHIGRLAEAERWNEAEEAGALLCCECGTCTYRCPGRRPLVQLTRLAKGEILRRQAAAREKAKNAGGAA